ncbi:MAG TPA: amidohydrolase family protein [Pseudonocardiaceae bacterium]|jgi:hypothetical protein|nr:amidohydrolase family protein [Pseudonocardiaceae bacterium]
MSNSDPTEGLLPCVALARLVDHHCHGLIGTDLDRPAFEALLTEADAVSPLGTSLFDSLIGLAVRRWCAPVLDLPPLAEPDDYLARRAELGAVEVNRRFLRTTGTDTYLVDEGFRAAELTSPGELGTLAGARTERIVRLETVAEDLARAGVSAAGFAEEFRTELEKRAAGAVGCKSIAAYRVGLDLAGERPAEDEVRAAAGDWLATGTPRLANPVLHRFLIWAGIDLRLPVQFHVGYGDSDVDLHRCDPLLLTDLLRATAPTGVPILLLHNYPYHRHAGYLAQVFPHVFFDLSLCVHNVGFRADAVIAEAVELAPFGKFLFATDAFGLAEFYHLGTLLFRRGLSRFLSTGIDAGELSTTDAARITALVTAANARRAYTLD